LFHLAVGNKLLIDLITLQAPKNGRILEAGCGTAQMSVLLADYGFDVTALDVDHEVLEYAKKRLLLKGVGLQFVEGSLFNLSDLFGEKHFDLVCHSGVLEHFSDEDIVRALSEQRKVSKKLIFKVPNHRNKMTHKHFGDERFLSNRRWKELIQSSGYTKVEVIGGDSFPVWIFLLPRGIFFSPKATYSNKLNAITQKLLFWRKYFSKHSIFICE